MATEAQNAKRREKYLTKKDALNTKRRQHAEINKDSINEKRRLYYANNPDYQEKNKQRMEVYREEHHEEILMQMKDYRLSHSDEIKAQRKQFRTTNKKYIKIQKKVDYEKNKPKAKERMQRYYKLYGVAIKANLRNIYRQDPNTYKTRSKKYRRTDIGKINKSRSDAKRNRELGYNPLNEYTEGTVGHHIDNTNVIFIPEDIHTSSTHSQNDNETMTKINILAWTAMESEAY